MNIVKRIEKNKFSNLICYYLSRLIYEYRITRYHRLQSSINQINRRYKEVFGHLPNLENPQTLNEKLQWIKLYDHKDYYTTCADKYCVRDYIRERIGDDYLIPLYFHTSNWRDIKPQNIDTFPCIIKANHSSKDFMILRSPEDVNWKKIRLMCRWPAPTSWIRR